MPKLNNRLVSQKGVALLLVLSSLLIVAILANIVLGFILNQARLTKHRVSRIQAYYAAQMGVVYAREKLRSGAWVSPYGTYYIKRNTCGSDPKCIVEPELPLAINNVTVRVEIASSGPYQGLTLINSAANYTYSNP
ncbi:MAG: hypothetical protein ABH882_05855 [Candidatus Omnitrophota bacterium]|nr:hypothetical protein [Candidatus Omnitrophota bacterium]MBU1928558.1 hypothetical protein [Candidatus Omnitrophota bacterium]MBU2034918.1 hypothetical protein [Candidatus Omnitrophota bacterium]MBU2222352.1 hypothetical protein [Candidatus Omnitrophota bacterium]